MDCDVETLFSEEETKGEEVSKTRSLWLIILRREHEPNKSREETALLVAWSFDQVLEWTTRDRMDERVEVVEIRNAGPIIDVLSEPKSEVVK